MTAEPTVALGSLVFLVIAFALLVRTVESGKRLADALASRFPDTYEALGRPRPSYFQSAGHTRFSRFVMRREYLELEDPGLVRAFEDQRRLEVQFLTFLVGGLVVLGAAMLLLRLT